MSFKRVAEVYAKQIGDHCQRDVLLALADECRGDSLTCYPGVPYLMWKTERSESSVKDGLAGLRKRKVVSKVEVTTGRGNFTGFKLHLDKLPNKPKGVKLWPLLDAAPDAEGAKKQCKKGHKTSLKGPKNGCVIRKEPVEPVKANQCGEPTHAGEHSSHRRGSEKRTAKPTSTSATNPTETSNSSRKRTVKRPPTTTPIPADFVATDKHRIDAAHLSLDADAEVEKFVAYHRGKGTVAADWDAKYSYWLMHEPKFKERRNGNPKGQDRLDHNIEAARIAIAGLNKSRG